MAEEDGLEAGATAAAVEGTNKTTTPTVAENDGTPGPFVCPHDGCSRQYSRHEHLVRHITSHENPQAYVCEVCQRGFARRDVLVRHQKSHDKVQTSGRRKSALNKTKSACKTCKSAKSRCDGQTPCLRCQQLSKDCVYDTRPSVSRSTSVDPSVKEDDDMDTIDHIFTAFEQSQNMSAGTATSSQQQQQPSQQQQQNHNQNQNHNHNQNTQQQQQQSQQLQPHTQPQQQRQHSTSINTMDFLNSFTIPFNQDYSLNDQSASTQKTQIPDYSMPMASGSNVNTSNTHPGSSSSQSTNAHGNLNNSNNFQSHASNNSNSFMDSFLNIGTPSTTFLGQSTINPSDPAHFTSNSSNKFSTQALFSDFNFNTLLFGMDASPDSAQTLDTTTNATFDLNALFPTAPEAYLSSLSQPHFTPSSAASTNQAFGSWPENNIFDQPGFTFSMPDLETGETRASITQAKPQDSALSDILLSMANKNSVNGQSTSPGRGFKKVPPISHGLHTRPSSPSGLKDSEEDWPTTWDPTQHRPEDGDVELGEVPFTGAYESGLNIPQLEESSRLSILELLRFADFAFDTYHHLYVRFSRVSLSTLNHFFRLYFQCVHPYLPMCHIPSLEPKKTSGFQLAAMVSLGAQFSPVNGAKSLSTVLGDVVHRSVGNVVTANHALARDLQMWTSLILWTQLRYTGVRRLMELTEVFRNAHTVPLGRMHLFDGRIPCPPQVFNTNVPLKERWLAWQAWEGKRRTGFACFLNDSEFTVFMNRPNVVLPQEMRAGLPCADVLWEAVNENDWDEKCKTVPLRTTGDPPACSVLDYRSPSSKLIEQGAQSAFGSAVLVQLVHVALWSFRQTGTLSPAVSKAVLIDMKRTLISIGGGPNEFALRQQAPNSSSKSWRAFAILYHQAHMSIRIPLDVLMAISGKQSMEDASKRRKEVLGWMQGNAVQAREYALHAAQCLKLIHLGELDGSCEVFSLFFCGLALHLYTFVAKAAFSGMEEYELFDVQLDTMTPSAVEVDWVTSASGHPVVEGVHLDGPNASTEILHLVILKMKRTKTWVDC